MWYRPNCHVPVQRAARRQQGCAAIQEGRERQRHFQSNDAEANCYQHLTIARDEEYLENSASTEVFSQELRKGNCRSSVQRTPKILYRYYLTYTKTAVPYHVRTGFGHSVGLSITFYIWLLSSLAGKEDTGNLAKHGIAMLGTG